MFLHLRNCWINPEAITHCLDDGEDDLVVVLHSPGAQAKTVVFHGEMRVALLRYLEAQSRELLD